MLDCGKRWTTTCAIHDSPFSTSTSRDRQAAFQSHRCHEPDALSALSTTVSVPNFVLITYDLHHLTNTAIAYTHASRRTTLRHLDHDLPTEGAHRADHGQCWPPACAAEGWSGRTCATPHQREPQEDMQVLQVPDVRNQGHLAEEMYRG